VLKREKPTAHHGEHGEVTENTEIFVWLKRLLPVGLRQIRLDQSLCILLQETSTLHDGWNRCDKSAVWRDAEPPVMQTIISISLRALSGWLS
jgi:hypothetical protein